MAIRHRIKIVCAACGLEFLDYPSSKRRYHNRACMLAHRKACEPTIQEKFWANVDRKGADECWEWTGHRYMNGYGCVAQRSAHRVSFEINKGPIPDGLIVMHSCDNRPCVNPAHLSLGTMSDNTRDMDRKGRRNAEATTRGERNPKCRLTEEMVREIRARIEAGEKQGLIAVDLGVSRSTVNAVWTGQTWGWLK